MAQSRTGIPHWLLGIALVLPMALVVGVLVIAAMVRGRQPDPLRLAEVPAPAAGTADCDRLLAALPDELDGPEQPNGTAEGGLGRRQLAGPVSSAPGAPDAVPGAAAWGEPPVVLRCGVDRPAELIAGSRLLDVSGVQFLQLAVRGSDSPAVRTWVAVDRSVYVMVILPAGSGSGPLQQLAEKIADTQPRQDVDVLR